MEEQKNYLEQYAGQGFENVSGQDYQVPFLRILQALSPQCNHNEDTYIIGAEPGKFYNSVTNKIYGDILKIIPIDFEKVWLEWKQNRGGFIGRHTPQSIPVDKSNFAEWLAPNGNTIVENYNFFCLLPDFLEDGLVVFPLNSTGIKHAKNWNSQIHYTKLPNGKPAPFFSSVWELKTVYNKNEKGTWFTIGSSTSNIKRIRYITEEELKNNVLPTKDIISTLNLDYAQIETTIKNEQDLLTDNTIVY